jgi:hypothetical protein
MDMIGDDGFNTRDMGRPVPWDLKIFEDVDFGQVEQHRCQGDFNGLLSKVSDSRRKLKALGDFMVQLTTTFGNSEN